MLRSERLEPVLGVATAAERRAAEAFAAGEARFVEAEAKLAELGRYEQEYRASLHERTAQGIDAAQLRAFHGFIGRLGDAIFQQGIAVGRARDERDTLRVRWIEATRRSRAVGKVIEHATSAERLVRERIEQTDSDERAQRSFAAGVRARNEGAQQPQPREEP